MKTTEDDHAATDAAPLAGVRVVEMGVLIAGPFCGQLLADFGADVIKVEQPGSGDPMREWGREKHGGRSLWWPIIARNKRSVTLDLRRPEGQELARRLCDTADVVLENFRPGTLERWGLGYERLRQSNPGLVLVRVTGFGQSGPYSQRPGYGAIGESMGGLRYLVGDGSSLPSRVGISLGDSLAGMFAAIGALVSLHARQRTYQGQVVDTAIYEAVLALMESLLPEYALAGHVRERSGPILPNVAPSNLYPTRDGQLLLVAANQDTVFARLAAAMGQPELAADPRFATHVARGEHQQELDDAISEWTATLDREDLERRLSDHAVPFGPIYTARDMLSDPHFAARESVIRVAHRELGSIPMQNVVPRLSASPGVVRSPGPELGEHNAVIYGDLLGLDAAKLEELSAAGVI